MANTKTLNQYPKYTVQSNGTVISKATGREVLTVLDASHPTVRLINRQGQRKRVRVSNLVKKAFAQ